MWRSGRIGGASGSVTVGNGRFREDRGATRSRGGNRLPLGDQEAVGGNAQCRVVMEAAPAAALVVPEAELLFQFLVVALDPPAQLGMVDQVGEANVLGQGRQPVLGRFGLVFGPRDQQPILVAQFFRRSSRWAAGTRSRAYLVDWTSEWGSSVPPRRYP